MNIGWQNYNRTMAGRGGLFGNSLLKSTTQRLERQAQRDSQVADLESRKTNLKSIECSSPEEAARILDMFHSYEEEIAAVKAAYNNAQMFHLMDEAMERGEQIADAIEKSAPKTEEERKREAVEEVLGTDVGGGLLSDILEKALGTGEGEGMLSDIPEKAPGTGDEEVLEKLQEKSDVSVITPAE